MPNRTRPNPPLLAAAVALAALLCPACSRPTPVEARDTPAALPSVAVVKATRNDLARELELNAEFRPYQEIDIHAKVAGYLRQIRVDVGDRVRQGQLLAVLEVPEMAQDMAQASAVQKRTELDVARAEAEVARAETARRIHELSYNRLAAVAKTRPNLIAQQEIDTAEARLREAEAQIATAKAALAATQEQVQVSGAGRARVGTMMDYLRITAPFSGVITKRYADPGAMIQAGTASQTQAMPVVRLSQVDRLRLVLPVPESIVARVKLGAPVEVRVDSLRRVVQGRVTRYTGRLEMATRTMDTEVDVPNPGGVLMPGMYASALLRLDQRTDALTLPVQALPSAAADAAGTRRLFVVGPGGVLAARDVRTGLETPNRVEILGGLREGEMVVVGARGGLRAGQRVEPKLAALATEGRH